MGGKVLVPTQEAIPGKQIQLSVDYDLQAVAEQSLGARPGAVVALDPRTGEILAMVSRPTPDPNDFAIRISAKEWNDLNQDPLKPLLNRAIQAQCPITLSIAGPITVSGQHQAWLIPLLETGWVAYLSTTDAVCYHDGHRSLNEHTKDPVYEVPIFGDDGQLRDEGVIRVTDMGFAEDVLLDQDKFLTALLIMLVFGQSFIELIKRWEVTQHIREYGPKSHLKKSGTP